MKARNMKLRENKLKQRKIYFNIRVYGKSYTIKIKQLQSKINKYCKSLKFKMHKGKRNGKSMKSKENSFNNYKQM